MESLYTKYRPQTFQDVVGQQVVVSTLENAVLEGRIGHAYLFCGPRGTGKTTMARLLAKALMCDNGPGKLPDGTCEQCKLIAAGEHPDVYELDAASRTGVDNVREEIINRVSYAPVRGRYKVYIIDEVHMLTTAAFNALLKTLEEPPEHVVFILCTTDPQKIPATIISRVQRFDFHSISNDEIHQRLAYVCQQEGFTYDDKALDLVVRHARGGMRDALSTLEQLSVFGNGSVTLDAAQDMLGSVPGSTLDSLCQAMAARDVASLYREVNALVSSGRDLLQFVRELAARVRDIYVVSAVGAQSEVVSASGDELKELEREAQQFGSTDRLAYVLTVLGDASNEMRTATNQRLSLEIALTRIARPESDLTLESLAARVAQLEEEVRTLKEKGVVVAAASASGPAPERGVAPVRPAGAAASDAAPSNSPASAPAADQPAAVASGQSAAQHGAMPRAVPSNTVHVTAPARPNGRENSSSVARPTATPVPPAEYRQPVRPQVGDAPSSASGSVVAAPVNVPASSAAITDPGELQRRWKQAVDTLIKRIPSRGSLLMSSSIVADNGDTLTVSLPKGSTFALKMLDRADVRQAIEPQISQVFGGLRNLKFVEGSPASAAGSHAGRQCPAAPARPTGQPAQRPATPTRPRQAPQPQPLHATAAPQSSPAPVPAAPVPPAQPSAPQPPASPARPAPQPAAAPAQGSAPQAQAEGMPVNTPSAACTRASAAGGATSAPAASPASYEMPWDPVAPVPTEAPHEEVTYSDADAMSYGDDAPLYEDAGAAPSAASQVSPTQASGASTAAGSAQADSSSAPGTVAASASPAPDDGASEEPVAFDSASIPDDIPDDLRNVIEDCFEVFGDGVQVSSVKPASQSGQAGSSDASGTFVGSSGTTPAP